jgi:hypothetical protein
MVRIESNDKAVSLTLSLLQQRQVSDMKQIKASIREYNSLTGDTPVRYSL